MARKRTSRPKTALLACSVPEDPVELVEAGAKDYRTITIIGDGETRMADGTVLHVDAECAAALIAEAAGRRNDIPIDLDHATLVNPDKGLPAPAVGFLDHKSLKYVPGKGIMAAAQWNDDGAAYIQSGAYRYRSPTLLYDKGTGRVTRLHSLSLTNKPLTIGAADLKAASERIIGAAEMPTTPPEADPSVASGPSIEMLIGELKNAMELDVDPGADVATVLMAILDKIKGGSGDAADKTEDTAAASELRTTLKLNADAKSTEVLTAVKTLVDKQNIGGESVAAMSERVKTLEAEKHSREVDAAIEQAIKAHKINPDSEVQMKACREFATRDVVGFSEYIAAQPEVLPASGRSDIPAGGRKDSREAIIAASSTEYDRETRDGAIHLTDKPKRVSQELIDAGLSPLSMEEIATL